jgi:hypothetical protein
VTADKEKIPSSVIFFPVPIQGGDAANLLLPVRLKQRLERVV